MKVPSTESLAEGKENGLHLIINLHLKMRLQLKVVSKSTIKKNECFNIMLLRTALTSKSPSNFNLVSKINEICLD